MEFKIELKNIKSGKLITNNDGKLIEYIIENDIITQVNPYNDSKTAELVIKKISNGTDAEAVKKIINLEKEGKLDEIASKNREKIAKNLSYEFSVGKNDNDITICDNSINKLKDSIFNTIQTEDIQDENVKEKIIEKIEEYKKYFSKKNELILTNDDIKWEKTE